jgi:CelD/BcsL family acetyltransferase involved in cellulose biosynthesis
MTSVSSELSVRCVEHIEGFKEIEADWVKLAEATSPGNIFATWQWHYSWVRHYLSERQLYLLLVFEHSELVGLAPFYIRHASDRSKGGCREVRFLGTEEVCSSYLDVLVAPGRRADVLTRLYQYLFEDASGRWDVLTLSEVPCESPSIDIWHGLFAEDGKVLDLAAFSVCPVVETAKGTEAIHQRIGRNARYNLARKTKYLRSLGRVTFERYTESKDIDRYFDEFVSLHHARWQAKGENGAFESPRFTAFHREISHTFGERGQAVLDFLSLNGERIAAIYGFVYCGTYSFYSPALNLRCAPKASPGFLLLAHCIEEASAGGIQSFDLLQGFSDYKMVWADRLRRSLTLQGYNKSMRAVSRKALAGLKETVKVLVR